ncbi:lyase family protein [Microbacterium sp. DT81.1]|uniref:lyase family protein n=1 Tax=Microbacterium sp. DT81.1 TaxID=3393413 RepID=UPI003CF35699
MSIDVGLLSPVTAGYDELVTDDAVLDALVTAEVALVRAYATVGLADPAHADAVSHALGWVDPTSGCRGHGLDAAVLACAAVSGGNPVIPLVGMLRDRVPEAAKPWVHRGATSQDILDSALLVVARNAGVRLHESLLSVEADLAEFAAGHRNQVAAARTLTQHAVPTTVGLRAANWLRGVRRAADRLQAAVAALPAQLGGAAGTLASFVEIASSEGDPAAASALPAAFAAEVGLAAPAAPWHTTRWPITELGDALVQVLDALGKFAADVATLSRTEIGELTEGAGGGSSAMPQKQNPVDAVLIRSAALRAPNLGATLHLAAALAVDERPDGAWHAEWPTLRELLRVALGATAHAASLLEGLTVDSVAVARNLASTNGRILAERLSIALRAVLGKDALSALLAGGEDLADALRAMPELEGIDVDALLDPADYTGLAGDLVDDVRTPRDAAR